jgi:hypothetical protein
MYIGIQFNYSIVTIMVGKLMWRDLANNHKRYPLLYPFKEYFVP